MAAPSPRPGPTTSLSTALLRVLAVVATGLALMGAPVLGQSPGSSVPPPVPVGPRVRALADKEVFGFLPCWALGEAAQSVDLDKISTLAFFSVESRAVWTTHSQEERRGLSHRV